MQTKTSYKPNYKSKLSPFHKQLQDRTLDYQNNPKHPINQEIKKNEGVFSFTAEIKQDERSLNLFKIPGLVSFACVLKRGNRIVGEGRGFNVIGKTNRFIENAVRYASGSAILDSVAKAIKTLGTLQVEPQTKDKPIPIEDLYEIKSKVNEPITDKQRAYLQELLNTSDLDEDERKDYLSNLSDFSRIEASEAIQKFKS